MKTLFEDFQEITKSQEKFISEINEFVKGVNSELSKLEDDPYDGVWDVSVGFKQWELQDVLGIQTTDNAVIIQFGIFENSEFPITFTVRIKKEYSSMSYKEIAKQLLLESNETQVEAIENRINTLKKSIANSENELKKMKSI